MSGPRPLGVTIVAYVTVVSGALGVFLGGSAILGRWSATPAWLAWGSLGYGVLCLAVAAGLFRGHALARIAATIAFALGAVQAVVAVARAEGPALSGVVTVVVMVAAALLLFTPRANDFFRR